LCQTPRWSRTWSPAGRAVRAAAVLGRAHALILRGNGALTCASNPELAVARMWQLAAACEVWLTASASGMPRPMDASEAESWRAAFYWAAVVATFAMGTAVGDLTAVTLHLGYLLSAVLFACMIAVPAISYRWLGWNSILPFWCAYVLTRPLGASVADWLGAAEPGRPWLGRRAGCPGPDRDDRDRSGLPQPHAQGRAETLAQACLSYLAAAGLARALTGSERPGRSSQRAQGGHDVNRRDRPAKGRSQGDAPSVPEFPGCR
jgi:repeat uncharacterized protein DUF347